ncbi:hypothetical protein GCM10011575_12190 [Microlunatus endophyticus]|uniref:Uncharacterized protein n=1 Tax=Microlunatus endophyticus TaxID=1716077 RepID=A0A917S5S5_9ACTN|nr:hypothetical protein GCM10011575_12190 [Microlunatus endophyticus]
MIVILPVDIVITAVAVPLIFTPVLGGGLTGRAGVPVSVYSQSTGAAFGDAAVVAAGEVAPAPVPGCWPQPASHSTAAIMITATAR